MASESPQSLTITVDGMSCGHCVRAVRSALESLPGVRVESVEIGEARVSFDPERVERQAVVDAVEDQGYQAYPAA